MWAQSYERSTASTSLLSIQDDIAHRIGAAIGDTRTGAVARAELDRTRNQPATELSPYECVALAYQWELPTNSFGGRAHAAKLRLSAT